MKRMNQKKGHDERDSKWTDWLMTSQATHSCTKPRQCTSCRHSDMPMTPFTDWNVATIWCLMEKRLQKPWLSTRQTLQLYLPWLLLISTKEPPSWVRALDNNTSYRKDLKCLENEAPRPPPKNWINYTDVIVSPLCLWKTWLPKRKRKLWKHWCFSPKNAIKLWKGEWFTMENLHGNGWRRKMPPVQPYQLKVLCYWQLSMLRKSAMSWLPMYRTHVYRPICLSRKTTKEEWQWRSQECSWIYLWISLQKSTAPMSYLKMERKCFMCKYSKPYTECSLQRYSGISNSGVISNPLDLFLTHMTLVWPTGKCAANNKLSGSMSMTWWAVTSKRKWTMNL